MRDTLASLHAAKIRQAIISASQQANLVQQLAPFELDRWIEAAHGLDDIYAASNSAATAEEMEQLAAQIRVERHVAAIDELGIPRFRITNGPVGSAWATAPPARPPPRCR